jgi:hypothetical protein
MKIDYTKPFHHLPQKLQDVLEQDERATCSAWEQCWSDWSEMTPDERQHWVMKVVDVRGV